jgi:O-succinylbenzoate synthase
VPLQRPWTTAAGSLSQRDSLLVKAVLRCSDEPGGSEEVEGWGECTALSEPTYSAEYTEGAVKVSSRYLAPALLRGNVASSARVGRALAGFKGHQMAKAAFEAAILDAELRATGTRMADFLASLSRCGQPPRQLVTAGVAVGFASSTGELMDEVEGLVARGYRRVKLKVRPGWDAEPVGAVRRRWPELVLLADANGSYSALGPQAGDHLAALDACGLVCIEQPLADDDFAGHAELARRLRTPLCLDEPLTSLGLVVTALAMGACSVVNVKAGRLGGYLEAVRVHDYCIERGVPVWCGGMVETGVGRASNLALSALRGFCIPGDLSASDRFFASDLTNPLTLEEDGTLRLPSGPGTGVAVSQEALNAFAVWRRWFPAG